MKENRQDRLRIFRPLVCGFLLAAAACFFPFAASCEELPDRLVRLRVVAASDAPADQAVKLKVRDAVTAEAAKWCENAGTREKASADLCLHLEAIRDAANGALRKNGFPENAAVQMTDRYFPTRDYETFRLPAGVYRTLQITIGPGQGRNWWCVAFPSLCLPAAWEEGDPLAFLPEQERQFVEHPQQYEIRFKAVELYQKLCSWLRGERQP